MRIHNHLLVILHIVPAVALITTSDIITNWLWYCSWI